ncbi:MAG TPA: UDP-N-acetylmuramoyl-tripeptide--D-alanyl-D-alanine ligase [Planctomycetaceae bacterium]|jgi:UDP-N-acetylmuramoyl-tripeptide--D-alanyl-D-alanine ligase
MEPVQLNHLLVATRAVSAGFGSALADGQLTFTRVSTDSRTTLPGDLFWAVRGAKYDGHNFINEAIRRGAIACVVERNCELERSGPRVIVDDTRRALADFARWYRRRWETLIIGVTGSVGKTTTREMIHAVLSAGHVGTQSRGNYNNEIGLPLSLLELSPDDEFAVYEMGAARTGDIRDLCEIACPEVGVITRIGKAHLETFGTIDNIYDAKAELLDALPQHGFAVIAGDDPIMRSIASRATCPVIFVGEQPANQVRATNIDFQPGRLQFTVDRQTYELNVPARHYLTAALCALAVAREIGMQPGAIAEGFCRFVGQPGRCSVEQAETCTIIDDTYNANPLSMQAACLTLSGWPGAGHKLFVVGDMLEQGTETARSHHDLGVHVAAARTVDRLLAFGDNAGHVSQGALCAGMPPHVVAECHELESLLTVLDCWLEPGDVVLVKGSRGMRMERVVHWLKQRKTNHFRGDNLPATARAVA